MAVSQGFARGFQTLADMGAQQRQADMQRRQFEEDQEQREFSRVQQMQQGRRAEERLDMAEQQHELDQEHTRAQMEKLGLLTDKVREQLETSRATQDDRIRQAEAQADNARATADHNRVKADTAADAVARGDAQTAFETINNNEFEDIADDPVAMADHMGVMSNALDSDNLGPANQEGFTVMPVDPNDLSKGFYEAQFGPDGVSKVKGEDGKASRLSYDEVRNIDRHMRSQIRQRANMSEGGGPNRQRNLDTLVENVARQRGAHPEQGGELIEGAPTPDEVRAEDAELAEEEAGLRRARNAALENELPEEDTEVSGTVGPGGTVQRRQQRTPVEEMSREERRRSLDDLSPEGQVFAHNVQNRGDEVVAERDTLASRTLPQSQRIQRHNEQVERQREVRPDHLESAKELLRTTDHINGEPLTAEQALNMAQTGDPAVSQAELREQQGEEQADFLDMVDEAVDGAGPTRIEEGDNAGAVKARWRTKLKSQADLLRQQNPEIINQITRKGGPGVVGNLIEEAQVLGEQSGLNEPNLFMALELQKHDANAESVGKAMKHAANSDAMQMEKMTPSQQRDFTRRVATNVENPEVKTDREAASQAWTDTMSQRQKGTPQF